MPPELLTTLGIELPLVRRDPHTFLPTTARRHATWRSGSNRAALAPRDEAGDRPRSRARRTGEGAYEAMQERSSPALPATTSRPGRGSSRRYSIEDHGRERYVRKPLQRAFIDLCRKPGGRVHRGAGAVERAPARRCRSSPRALSGRRRSVDDPRHRDEPPRPDDGAPPRLWQRVDERKGGDGDGPADDRGRGDPARRDPRDGGEGRADRRRRGDREGGRPQGRDDAPRDRDPLQRRPVPHARARREAPPTRRLQRAPRRLRQGRRRDEGEPGALGDARAHLLAAARSGRRTSGATTHFLPDGGPGRRRSWPRGTRR